MRRMSAILTVLFLAGSNVFILSYHLIRNYGEYQIDIYGPELSAIELRLVHVSGVFLCLAVVSYAVRVSLYIKQRKNSVKVEPQKEELEVAA